MDIVPLWAVTFLSFTLMKNVMLGYDVRPDRKFPLSIDSTVWPSVAQSPWGLYTDFRDLHALMAEAAINSSIVISVSVFIADDRPLSQHTLDYLIEYGPRTNPDGYISSLLGYDVADSFLSSLLYFQGAGPDSLKNAFTHKINARGLVMDPESAEQILASGLIQVPEHAPYYIYTMNQLQRVQT